MTVIVTMAGAGSRFCKEGYKSPKHMIRAHGKTLFEWSMQSLSNFYDQHFIFACLAEHDCNWIRQKASEMGISDISVLPRSSISMGQAQTAYEALEHTFSDEAIWIFNIDTYVESGLSPLPFSDHFGCVHVFKSINPSMSFVNYDNNGLVVELAEKKVISEWATIGFYGFNSASLYRQLYVQAYRSCEIDEVGGEHYIAPMYQILLNNGKSIIAPKLDLNTVHILGTPQEVLNFDPTAKPPNGS